MKIGDKIRIIKMNGEPQYEGKEGIIEHIDDLGQIHGSWGGCALIPNVDEFIVVQERMSDLEFINKNIENIKNDNSKSKSKKAITLAILESIKSKLERL